MLCVAAQHLVVLPHSGLACCPVQPSFLRGEGGEGGEGGKAAPATAAEAERPIVDFELLVLIKLLRPDRLTPAIQNYVSKVRDVRCNGLRCMSGCAKWHNGFLSAPCATGHVREVCNAPSAPGLAKHTPRHSLRCSDCECRSYRFVLQYSEVFKQSTAASPVVFVLSPGADPAYHVAMLADKLGFGGSRLKMCSLGQGQGPLAAAHIDAGMTRGQWVMLQVGSAAHFHPAPSIGVQCWVQCWRRRLFAAI